MTPEATAVIEIALINLAFTQAELALTDDSTGGIHRALHHLKIAISDLTGLVPSFGRLEEDAA